MRKNGRFFEPCATQTNCYHICSLRSGARASSSFRCRASLRLRTASRRSPRNRPIVCRVQPHSRSICMRPPLATLPPPASPAMPPSCFSIFCICTNCFSSRFTSSTDVPLPLRDALAAAAVDDLLLAPLVRRHRADDRLDARHLLLVGLLAAPSSLRLPMPGQHPDDLLERPHLPDRLAADRGSPRA